MGKKKKAVEKWPPLNPELAKFVRRGRESPQETLEAIEKLRAEPWSAEAAAAWDKVREYLDEGLPPELRHFRPGSG